MRPNSEDLGFSLRKWQPQVGPEQGKVIGLMRSRETVAHGK